MIVCVKVCERGFSHQAVHKPCQDAAGTQQETDWTVVAVADGHGGEKYLRSAKGSSLAVETAKDCLRDFYEQVLTVRPERNSLEEKHIEQLKGTIILRWQEKVKAHFKSHPLTELELRFLENQPSGSSVSALASAQSAEDGTAEQNNTEPDSAVLSLYGTTLLAALYLPSLPLWIALQIGDGLTAALDETGAAFYPIPEDESLGFGYTTSLCSSEVYKQFRHKVGTSKLKALCVCSDGVADSFEKEKFADFVKKIRRNIIESGVDAVQKELKSFFPKLSEQGSRDDVSFAGLFETDDAPSSVQTEHPSEPLSREPASESGGTA